MPSKRFRSSGPKESARFKQSRFESNDVLRSNVLNGCLFSDIDQRGDDATVSPSLAGGSKTPVRLAGYPYIEIVDAARSGNFCSIPAVVEGCLLLFKTRHERRQEGLMPLTSFTPHREPNVRLRARPPRAPPVRWKVA